MCIHTSVTLVDINMAAAAAAAREVLVQVKGMYTDSLAELVALINDTPS